MSEAYKSKKGGSTKFIFRGTAYGAQAKRIDRNYKSKRLVLLSDDRYIKITQAVSLYTRNPLTEFSIIGNRKSVSCK